MLEGGLEVKITLQGTFSAQAANEHSLMNPQPIEMLGKFNLLINEFLTLGLTQHSSSSYVEHKEMLILG